MKRLIINKFNKNGRFRSTNRVGKDGKRHNKNNIRRFNSTCTRIRVMEAKKLGSLYLIEWVDSYSTTEGWELIKDIEEPYLMVCRSVGYILKENDKNIMIAPHISDINNVESLGAYRGALVIPRDSVIMKVKM